MPLTPTSRARTVYDLCLEAEALRERARRFVGALRSSGQPRIWLFEGTWQQLRLEGAEGTLEGAEGTEGSRRPLVVFPGSFHPVTRAHLGLVEAARRAFPGSAVLLLLDLRNVDKPTYKVPLADRHAGLADRLAMLAFTLRGMAKWQATPRVFCGVSSGGLFIEKLRALRNRWKGRVVFVVGEDTLERLFEPKYYLSITSGQGRGGGKVIEELLAGAELAFARRGGRRGLLERVFSRWSTLWPLRNRVHELPLGRLLRRLSATRARAVLGRGGLPLAMVPERALLYAAHFRLYGSLWRTFRWAVTAFLARDGMVLLVRRSRKVGSYRGHWSGVSGYLEWPVGELEGFLRGRLSVPRALRRALEQSYREIAEEVSIDSERLRFEAMGRPVTIDDRGKHERWKIVPVLFSVRGGVTPRLDWENTACRWVKPAAVVRLRGRSLGCFGEPKARFRTVPGLPRALDQIWKAYRHRRIRTLGEVVRELVRDRRSGSVELALRGSSDFREWLRAGALDLADSRALLLGALKKLLRAHPMAALAALQQSIAEAARDRSSMDPLGRALRRFERSLEAGARNTIQKAARALAQYKRIISLSYSSTVLGLLVRLRRKGPREVLIVRDAAGNSRRLVRELGRRGVRARLLDVGEAFPADVSSSRCCLVVGADAVWASGAFVNARGTAEVVRRARRRGVPVFVVAQRAKFFLRDRRSIFRRRGGYETVRAGLASGFLNEES